VHFIGDIHGDFDKYEQLIGNKKSSIQVGDMGIGFCSAADRRFRSILLSNPNHAWIRGNHDNPAACLVTPNYLGDYGYINDLDLYYMGGAWSIDRERRVEGQDWWAGEQLSERQLTQALHEFAAVRPRVMVTHECPHFLSHRLVRHSCGPAYLNFTSLALEKMWELHQPEKWYFGHWHQSKAIKEGRCEFRCVASEEVVYDPSVSDF